MSEGLGASGILRTRIPVGLGRIVARLVRAGLRLEFQYGAQSAGDRHDNRQPRRLWILVGVPQRRRMSRRWRAPPHEAQLDATAGGLAAPLRGRRLLLSL